jgi:hypothetical protein
MINALVVIHSRKQGRVCGLDIAVNASHTLSEVAEIADRVLLLEAGRVKAFDFPRGLCAATGAGIISASYTILFKRGNPAKWLVLGISGLVGGMMYPVSVLPGPLRFLARLIPVTYSLEGMRAALLGGAGWRELWPSIVALLLFAAILIPLSFLVFAWALRRTKVTSTLTYI